MKTKRKHHLGHKLTTISLLSAFTLMFSFMWPGLHPGSRAVMAQNEPKIYAAISNPKPQTGDDITVDWYIDTANKDTLQARVSINFDPNVLTIVDIQYGDIYCDYPNDQFASDNEKGFFMLTGFCNSTPYNSATSAGLLGRTIFRAKNNGNANIQWRYTGSDDGISTVLMSNNSPPQNLLSQSPAREEENQNLENLAVGETQQESSTQEKPEDLPDSGQSNLTIATFTVAILLLTAGTMVYMLKLPHDSKI